MALQRDVEAVAQDVPGVAFVNSEPGQLGLVDQNPADVAPEEARQRAMRVRLLVGELMVPAVDRDPARRRFLQARHRDHHHRVLQPFRTFQAAMGEQPVVAKVDAEQSAQMGAGDGDDQPAPAEITGQEGQHRGQMVGADDDDVGPVELERPNASRQRYPGIRRRRGEGCGEVGGVKHRSLCGRPGSGRHSGVGSVRERSRQSVGA